jgi:hypothetical protein
MITPAHFVPAVDIVYTNPVFIKNFATAEAAGLFI